MRACPVGMSRRGSFISGLEPSTLRGMARWARIAVITVTILLAAAAWLVHTIAIGAWCGAWSEGPTGEQVNFCENQSAMWVVTLPTVVFILVGAIAAAASSRVWTVVIWWVVG